MYSLQCFILTGVFQGNLIPKKWHFISIKSLSIEFYSKFQDRSRTGPQSFWAERPQDRSFQKGQDRGHPSCRYLFLCCLFHAQGVFNGIAFQSQPTNSRALPEWETLIRWWKFVNFFKSVECTLSEARTDSEGGAWFGAIKRGKRRGRRVKASRNFLIYRISFRDKEGSLRTSVKSREEWECNPKADIYWGRKYYFPWVAWNGVINLRSPACSRWTKHKLITQFHPTHGK